MIRDGAISEAQTRFWMRQISLAIQYLHRMQISHRDIKCENILVTRNNNVKLCDFGFTRYVVDTSNKKLLSETFCGSLSYASPEILKGLPYAPKVSDMWAFGVMVFTMLNKAMPFDDTHATVRNSKIKAHSRDTDSFLAEIVRQPNAETLEIRLSSNRQAVQRSKEHGK